ncbi:TPA: hypothetical protein HA241_07870 [Candidatus Woesearchaeota archaeon]|nr:hypothetical protein [Candidatus Woesearchaeota archaeon]
MKKIILATFLVFIVLLTACSKTVPEVEQPPAIQVEEQQADINVAPAETDTEEPRPEVEAETTTNIKTFVLTGENFKFIMEGEDNSVLRVKQGDRVRIEFTSTSGFHDWVVDEFGARTEKVKTGLSSSIEFVADKKGTFEYYCSVGAHRAEGMKGNLIVE